MADLINLLKVEAINCKPPTVCGLRQSDDMEIGSAEWKDVIVKGARQFSIDVLPEQADRFALHALLLKEWNQKINLTAIESPMGMAVKHFLDSIIPFRYITPGSRLLDVGSGAGFPGIPLKVMIPSSNMILVDATRKKVSFLHHVIRRLHLCCITPIHSRIEDLRPEREGKFDIIVCRAFSSLAEFAEKSMPLLAPGGLLLAMKGKEISTGLPEESTRGGEGVFSATGKDVHTGLQMTCVSFELPFLNLSRTLILLRR